MIVEYTAQLAVSTATLEKIDFFGVDYTAHTTVDTALEGTACRAVATTTPE